MRVLILISFGLLSIASADDSEKLLLQGKWKKKASFWGFVCSPDGSAKQLNPKWSHIKMTWENVDGQIRLLDFGNNTPTAGHIWGITFHSKDELTLERVGGKPNPKHDPGIGNFSLIEKIPRPASTDNHTNHGEVTIVNNQSKILSLLVTPLGNSRYAGQTSTFSISALPDNKKSGEPANLTFNQEVGETMDSALDEVIRYLKLKHDGWPKGFQVELAFSEKYSPKDGPSAAVASALLMNSLITGTKLNEAIAVTGDMNASGEVQGVGGIFAKLRAAKKGGASIVAIPQSNRIRVIDLVLLEGISPVLNQQIFTITDFDQAFELAKADSTQQPVNLSIAIDKYSKLIEKLRSRKLNLQSAEVNKELDAIVRLTPNHLSARTLQLYLTKRIPKTLSLSGSLAIIEQTLGSIPEAAKSDINSSNNSQLSSLGDIQSDLRSIRSKLDVRTKNYVDGWIDWTSIADEIVTGQLRSKNAIERLNSAHERAIAEYQKLTNNVEVMEELLQ